MTMRLPKQRNAAETEILSAVADIASEEDETKDGAGPAPSGTVETIAGGTSPSPA